MKNLKIYEEFEENENDLDNDQDFEVEVEFQEYINNWEKEHAIPMTRKELEIQFTKEAIEMFLKHGGDLNNLLGELSKIGSVLPDFLNKLKSKCDWYNDSLETSVLDKIWNMISDHEDPEEIEWSQDDDEYMALSGEEEEDDDLEQLRQRSFAKYAEEDEDGEKEDEIYAKVKQGMKSGQKYQLPEEEEGYLQRKADKFLKRYEMKNIKGFKSFKS
jgi:hypothetical protein